MYDIFLSLGSNIEPRDLNLKNAIILLNKQFKFVKLSSLYSTKPLDDLDQEYFYNICVHYKTNISNPFEILNHTKNIENILGRVKDSLRPKGPRNIDIDILLISGIDIKSDILTIPHKSMNKRNFVLIPLSEILENYPINNLEYELKKLIEKNKSQKVKKIGELKIE
jgi:2-amino-4-hydroxy-6-hydroxymethyldihydropteridine diphosphokinase